MSEFQAFLNGFSMIFEIKYFLLMFGGITFGVVLGALPGLTGSMGIALMLPFTYNMDALSALVFLLSIYSGGLFGGAITAVLINTPGSPANLATVLEGYPMTLKGKAEEALGISLFASVIGGVIGCIFLVGVMEPLANLSLEFGPSEMFMVAFFGLTVVGSMSSNVLKSVYVGLFGILLGTVGMSASGAERGTFGSMYLFEGIPLIPALIGFLAMPELFTLISKNFVSDNLQDKLDVKRILHSLREIIKRPILTLVSAFIGIFVGVMPAAGATVAGLLSYNQAKQWSKSGDQFGTGVPEGIIASETANNASESGALATMLVLGLPGSASTAMLLGAIMIQGWVPGPRLFLDNRDIIYASISSLFLQQFVMLLVGIVICVFAAKVITIPTKYLIPCITLFTILGAYSTRNTLFDAGLMLVFGLIGWTLKQNDIPVMPLVLGIILGPIADRELLRVLQIYSGNYVALFYRPITMFLLAMSLASIFLPLLMKYRKRPAR